jgi:Mg2+ and Co2+ transporter CorA
MTTVVSDTLESIANNIREITRMISADPSSKQQCLQKLHHCLAALTSISTAVGNDQYQSLHNILVQFQTELISHDNDTSNHAADRAYSAARVHSGIQ